MYDRGYIASEDVTHKEHDKLEFGILCCLATSGLRKDIQRQIRQLYSHQVLMKFLIMSIIITYYHHFRDHILTFILITNLLYFLIQVDTLEHKRKVNSMIY